MNVMRVKRSPLTLLPTTVTTDKTRILPTEPNGVVGEFGFYIPAYTAKRNVDFLSFYGLSGDESRIKLANTFKEPTTWRDYCEGVDPSNCTNQDDKGISKRYPVTTEEKDSYFIPNLYTGHFRVTDRSNCTKNNNTCTGNVIGPSCNWSTYVDSQMYWNNISLTLNGGPNQVNNGYSYTQMTQVWRAANATKSNVFMWWWTPDILVDEFQGGDYSFQRVTLPTPTEECIKYRASELNAAKCSADIELRRGEAVGSCDYDAVIWQKVMSRGLKSSSLSEEDENALRSPAYEFLNKFALPAYSMSSIFQQWTKLMAENGTVYDTGFAARESICELVYNSYEEIMRQFPKGFPRERETSTYSGLSFAGYVFGSIALALAIIAAICLNIWRDNKVIKIAQLNVLTAMIAGYIFAGLAAVLHAVAETSDAVCTLQQWTLLLCYCLEFVPIMAKISSINKLGRAARLFRKVQIDPNLFKKYLATSIGVVVAYLIIWTAVDMPRKIDDIKIIEEEAKTTVVAFYAGCASSSQVWGVVALVFESFVLLGASVLAYQSRDIIERMDEGCWLAFLVYSHAMFLIVRIAIKVLVATDTIMASMSTKIIAIVVALETIAAILVYFLPKFVRIKSKKAFKEIPVQLRGSTSNPMGYGRGQKKGKGGKRYITGITIPEGGIPNLIRKKPAEINGDSLKTAATSRRLSTESCSSNLPSTRRLSFTSRSSNLKTAKTSLSEDGALSSTSQDSRDAEIEKLMNELRKRNADVDLLTRKIYEHKRRGSLHSPFVSSVGDPVNKRRTSVVTFATSTSASPDFI